MTSPLFRPFATKSLSLPNRLVMAPMTRSKSPGSIPGTDVAAYYRRRAEGGFEIAAAPIPGGVDQGRFLRQQFLMF